jgi:hypothetical protein
MVFSVKRFLVGGNTWLMLCLFARIFFDNFSTLLCDYQIWIPAFLMTVFLPLFPLTDFVPRSWVYRRMAGAVFLSYLAFVLLVLGVHWPSHPSRFISLSVVLLLGRAFVHCRKLFSLTGYFILLPSQNG